MRSRAILRGRGRWSLPLTAVGIVVACGGPELERSGNPAATGGTGAVIVSTGGSSGKSGKGGGGGKSNVDTGPVVTAEFPPPPISGGTLLVLKEGGRAVVSDPDRDRVSIVRLATKTVEVSFPLEHGAQPGRLAEDADGRVHVALRGSGEVMSIDTRENAAVDRRAVCRSPRGVAYDPSLDRVLVACQEGALVELPAGAGEIQRATAVAQDLRDVVFAGDQLVLTRFRAAELLYLDSDRQVVLRVTPPVDEEGFAASVAWRALATPEGDLAISHQRAFSGVIDVGEGPGEGVGGESGVAGGSGAIPGNVAGLPGLEAPPVRSGYGIPSRPCSSVVESTVTFADSSGGLRFYPHLDRMALPVDVAFTDEEMVVASAGASRFSGMMTIGLFPRSFLQNEPPCVQPRVLEAPPNVVAVAFDPTTKTLIAQTREPAWIVTFDPELLTEASRIELGPEAAFDTGHEIFHMDAGGGVACASCHPEGAEDGRVWHFGGFGDRRTQPLDVGLEGTAPFHWNGELPAFADLMQQVFQGRMSGPFESVDRQVALEQYVYSIPRRAAVRDAADEAALRGKALFESKEVGCAECHSGPKLTTGENANIGRGEAFQIPSLIAVSARAPYMHDGCAATLLDRFDPTCGGPRHGQTEGLEPSDLDDLVAYLETL